MTGTVVLAQSAIGQPVFTVFAIFVVCALLLAVWAGPDQDTANEFFVSDRRLSSAHNGLALFGDYISAATLLGTPGLVALVGYDGLPYVLGPVVGWVVILLLIAEPFHATGRFTIGDSLARRLRPRPAHTAAGVCTLVISMLYLIAQLVGAGALAAPVLGVAWPTAQKFLVAFLGVLMILYAAIGGMKAATLVQTLKAVFLLAASAYLALLILSKFGWNLSDLLGAAAHGSGAGEGYLRPGLRFGNDGASKLDSISLQLALVLGAAGLPHVLMRLRVVPTARAARQSVQWTTLLTCAFCLIAGVFGLGAVAELGAKAIADESPSGNMAILLLAKSMGGWLLLVVMSCAAFATILAVVAGTALASATSFAHDIYGVVIKHGRASKARELFVARVSAVVIGGIATALSLYAQDFNVSFLAGLAFAVAASANLPTILYNLYWKRFTTTGATWSMYGGLLCSIALAVLSPAVSGSRTSLFPNTDFAVFPLENPGIVAIPLAFLLGWLGSLLGREQPDETGYSAVETRVLTGANGP